MISGAPLISVGVSVFRGWQHVEEALRSLQSQTFTRFHAVISVDGNDRRSAELCRPFIADPRFQLTVHERRLGWTGNLNWLLSRAETDFFCHFPQDDLLHPDYFAALIKAAAHQPAAGVFYSELKYFGGMQDFRPAPSIAGDAMARVVAQINELHFLPFRGLIRRDVLRAAGRLRDIDSEGFGEDVIWIAKLARIADICGVPRLLYFKRWHEANTSKKWWDWPQERRREPWIGFCAGLLAAVLPAARSPGESYELFFRVLERLAVDSWFFDSQSLPTPARRQLLLDFMSRLRSDGAIVIEKTFDAAESMMTELALLHFGIAPARSTNVQELPSWQELRRRRDGGTEGLPATPAYSHFLYRMGTVIDFSAQSARRYLHGAWGETEPWGVWTVGSAAELTLWLEPDHADAVVMRVFALPFLGGSHRSSNIEVRVNDRPVAEWGFDIADPQGNALRWCEARFALTGPGPLRITFVIDRPISPASLGILPDQRTLGLGVQTLSLLPVED